MTKEPLPLSGKSPLLRCLLTPNLLLVRERGLEPPRLTAPAPKTGVSTNSTTRACCFAPGVSTKTYVSRSHHSRMRDERGYFSRVCDKKLVWRWRMFGRGGL